MVSDRDSIRPDRSAGDGIAVDVRDGGMAIFSLGRSPMSVFDPGTGRILEVNDAWVERYGYCREEARQIRVQDVSAEPDRTSEAVRGAIDEGGALITVRWHRDKSGTVFPVEITSGTIRMGERVLMFAVMHDIEPRLTSEKRLQRSEARFRALVEKAPIGIVVHRAGRVVYANPGLKALLGLEPPDELVGRPLLDIVHPDDREWVLGRIATIARDGRTTPPMEGRLVRADGSGVPVEVSGIPFEFDGEPAVLAMLMDLRERKQMEAQLVLADRLASLGRLAASVGHEINNPLAYLLGNIQLLERDLRQAVGLDELARETLQQRLTILEEGALRVRDIVRDLKTLSGGEPEMVQGASLGRVLDMCANMAEHEIKPRATLVRDYGADVVVHASESRLGQVFLNLLVNAAQAIPEGDASANEIRVATELLPGSRVRVEVSDTGSGVSAAHRDRIFEPFFTTKASGGTGLGLSICHSIVTGLGGTISVEQRDPHGTRFSVVLPCAPTNGALPDGER